jgi:hypothetical protein
MNPSAWPMTCDRHPDSRGNDEIGCYDCADRTYEAHKLIAKRKKLRDLKAASNKAYISDGTIDAMNRVWHYVEIENNARDY